MEKDDTDQPTAPADIDTDFRFSASTLAKPPNRITEVDVVRFQKALDDSDMTDAEKAEYLQIIWTIILELADMGCGLHPLNSVARSSDKAGRSQETYTRTTPNAADQWVAEREEA